MDVVRVLLVDDQRGVPARDGVGGRRDTGVSSPSGAAISGEECLPLAEALQPDLVLLDVNLPGIDGVETAGRLGSGRSVPVVVLLSTYDEDAGERFVAESGAAAYLTKSAFGSRATPGDLGV